MCPHLNNNFTPVADNLPSAAVCDAESAAGGSQFRSGGGVESNPRGMDKRTTRSNPNVTESAQSRLATGPLASFPIPHICISCSQTLRAKQDASRVVVYCGYGPCKSKAANESAFGRTVEEAVDELNARILEEPYAE